MARVPGVDQHRIAAALLELSRSYERGEKNRFKANAFRRASRTIETLETDLGEMIAKGALETLPGIGKSTAAVITELARTGASANRETAPPPGVPGTGPFLLPVALEAAEIIATFLRGLPGVEAAEIAGGIRRRMEVVENINLSVASPSPAAVLRAIAGAIDGFKATGPGEGEATLQNGIVVRIRAVKPPSFGPLLAVQTGSSLFVESLRLAALAKGLKLTEEALTSRGKVVSAPTEKELFKQLGARFVPPELREEAIPAARSGAIRLVEPTDLLGTFHAHSTWSDGKATVKEMLFAARAHGWQYIGMSDHSKTASYAGGLSETDVERQQGEISRHQRSVAPMHVFRGTEADILADGRIDYADTILDRFDFVVASVHSRFKMSREEMTERIVTAMSNPLVTFLGHMTGRRLLTREPYLVDFDRVFDVAAERGVIIEINGHPNRLDLDWRHIRNALDRGVLFSIHPDAHSVSELGYVLNGTWVARKGGLTAKQIFNTRSLAEVKEYLAKRRESARSLEPRR